MSNLSEQTVLAFRDELRKEALFSEAVAKAAPRLKNIGALGGLGAAVGTLGGAGIGAVRNYRAAREQGDSRANAAIYGLMGAGGGAAKGALIGGLAGGIGGGLMKQDLTHLGQLHGPLGAGARFGQRQVHSLTGMMTPAELEWARGGAWSARQELAKAQQNLAAAHGPDISKHTKAFDAAQPHLKTVEEMQNAGLTSVPGVLRGLGSEPGKVMRAGMREMGPMGALMFAGPAAWGVGQTLKSKEETDALGHGKGERIGEEVGRTVGGAAGGLVPIAGNIALAEGFGRLGGIAGRGVDRLRGKGSTPPGMAPSTQEPAWDGQNLPSERIMSPAAAGQAPDIGL